MYDVVLVFGEASVRLASSVLVVPVRRPGSLLYRSVSFRGDQDRQNSTSDYSSIAGTFEVAGAEYCAHAHTVSVAL